MISSYCVYSICRRISCQCARLECWRSWLDQTRIFNIIGLCLIYTAAPLSMRLPFMSDFKQ